MTTDENMSILLVDSSGDQDHIPEERVNSPSAQFVREKQRDNNHTGSNDTVHQGEQYRVEDFQCPNIDTAILRRESLTCSLLKEIHCDHNQCPFEVLPLEELNELALFNSSF